MTVTLPAAASAGANFKIRLLTVASGLAYVFTTGGESINGSAQYGLSLDGRNRSTTLISDGSGWLTLETSSASLPNLTSISSYGYFIITQTTTGALGGLSGANATCLSRLRSGSWKGKLDAEYLPKHLLSYLLRQSVMIVIPATVAAFTEHFSDF